MVRLFSGHIATLKSCMVFIQDVQQVNRSGQREYEKSLKTCCRTLDLMVKTVGMLCLCDLEVSSSRHARRQRTSGRDHLSGVVGGKRRSIVAGKAARRGGNAPTLRASDFTSVCVEYARESMNESGVSHVSKQFTRETQWTVWIGGLSQIRTHLLCVRRVICAINDHRAKRKQRKIHV